MQEIEKQRRIRKWLWVVGIALLCGITITLDFVKIELIKDDFRNDALLKILQQVCGVSLAILLMRYFSIKLFKKPQNLLYIIPCLLIAIDNFQWSSFLSGKMHLVRTEFIDILLFIGTCLIVGLFEELIFRGVLFSVLAGTFSNDKKGLWKTYILSSVLFGVSHLFNGFSMATLLQVGYSTLTGGLFAFCLLKTKNIFFPALIHSVYNFCGMLFDTRGLGSGVIFDLGTVITMAIVSVSVGIFVLYKVWKYSDEERAELYARLGVHQGNMKDSAK